MKVNNQPSRTIWQPLNRKSQIVATIMVLTAASLQVCLWHTRSIQSPQPQPVQQLPTE